MYTFQDVLTPYIWIPVEDLFHKVTQFKRSGGREVEIVKCDGVKFHETILSLAYEGVTNSKKNSPKFIVVQNFQNFMMFRALLGKTKRFIEVMNDDSRLIDFTSGWISSKYRAGYVFGNFLKCIYEAGIYSYWKKRGQKFTDGVLSYRLRKGIKEYNSALGLTKIASEENKPFSFLQLSVHFALWGIGLVIAFATSICEKGWLFWVDTLHPRLGIT